MRRAVPAAVAAAAVALLLSACPPDDGSVPSSLDPAALEGPSATSDRETEVEPDQDGSPELDGGVAGGEPSPGADGALQGEPGVDGQDDAISVCVLLPTSGESKEAAAEMRRGMRIAQAEIEAESWRKRRIKWIEENTRSTEAGALAAFQRCIAEGFPMVLGPVNPAAATAIVPVAAAHNVTLLFPELGAALPTSWGDRLFAVAPAATSMGRVAGEDARSNRSLKKAAILHAGGHFGTSQMAAFRAAFEQEESKVVFEKELNKNSPKDWAVAAQVAAQTHGADALFVVGPDEVGEAIAKALRVQPLENTQAWFIDWAMYPTVLTAAGSEAIGRVHWVNRLMPRGEFAQTYQTRYQARPEFPAGSGYDAIILAANAIEGAATLEPEDIAKTLADLKGMPSAFGTGAMTVADGIPYEDVAGYVLFEPKRSEDTGTWMFGEP